MFDIFPWLTPEIKQLLLNGLVVTIVLTVVTSGAALVLGVLIGWLRLSASFFVRTAATGYIEIFRNIPALVAVIFWAYALPNAFDPETRRMLFFDNLWIRGLGALTGLSIPYYAVGAAIGLTLNTSAYIAELFRSGVGTLAREHWEAARSLGASANGAFLYVLLPHGLGAASPAVVTRLVHNLKNTALAAFVAVPEFFKSVQTSIGRSFHAVELLLLASVCYWLLSWAFAGLLRRWLSPPRESGGVVG
jgi:polar amino acid transport system permease protein